MKIVLMTERGFRIPVGSFESSESIVKPKQIWMSLKRKQELLWAKRQSEVKASLMVQKRPVKCRPQVRDRMPRLRQRLCPRAGKECFRKEKTSKNPI